MIRLGQARRAPYLLVGPAVAALAVGFALPVAIALGLSFTDFDLYGIADASTVRFVGLANYARLVHEPLFGKALANTAFFVLVGAPLALAVSLGAALLLHSRLARWQALLRTALFSPVVTTVVAVAVIWRYLLHTRYGLLNYALGLVGVSPVDWLGDPRWAMPAIILFAVWKGFGVNMVILLAALQAIPKDQYEAAWLDGAGALAQFRYITLPALTPTLLVVTVMTMIGYCQLFAEPYVMTQGGPAQSTISVLYFMFEEGFKWWNLGFASAVAFVLFAILAAGAAAQLSLARRWSRP